MKKYLLSAVLGVCPLVVLAQSRVGAPVAPVSVAEPTARPIPGTPLAPNPVQTITMALRWNDTGGGFRIPVQNDSDQPLHIDAIQSSGDLFIASFPPTVPPGGSADLIVVLDAKPGTSTESDVIRLKTSQGEKTLVVAHNREKVATLDRTEINWAVGETATAKSVVLQISGGVTQLAKVRAMAGAAATVDDLGGGKFRINVTPRSTATPTSFPVILDFSPALPGATPMITCSVGTRG